MFTGLVTHLGTIESTVRQSSGIVRLSVTAKLEKIVIGESIMINGACLTVTSQANNLIAFDVSQETVERTNVGKLVRGAVVNLERALAIGDRLGGHIVSGHIDTVGTIRAIRPEAGSVIVEVVVGTRAMAEVVEKGSVAIDGISLTVSSIKADAFTLGIIPHTIENTNLNHKHPGDTVNVEFDLFGKYVRRYLDTLRGGKVLDEMLKNF